MCGLAGFIDLGRSMPGAVLQRTAVAMADTIRHRGPDDGGVWADAAAGVAIGFRRLAIVDLSPAGHQPMVSASGRFVIAYNGEIYNAAELRAELEAKGTRFRSHSDTEVVLEACAAWGTEVAVRRFLGMFAFVLWDREDRSLSLVRDRLGIKPLYWGRHGQTIFFGSQPKAFFEHPSWRPEICRDTLAAFLRFSYVPAAASIFRGMAQLRPGHIGRVDNTGKFSEIHYWDIAGVARYGIAHRIELSDVEAIDHLEGLLQDSVSRRMIADVPLGAFLSGGVDSSLVAALMQAMGRQATKTFAIGFTDDDYNEAPYAKVVAKHLGTDHHELYVEPRHALEVIPRLQDWFDEPFADSSQIPTYLVSQLARQHVTVSLSGDGGDELFAGYTRYAQAEQMRGHAHCIPRLIREPMGGALTAGLRLLPASLRARRTSRRLGELADLMRRSGEDRMYRALLTMWDDPVALAGAERETNSELWTGGLARTVPDFAERMTFIDTVAYLPGDILTKVDRASMATALEARVPLLDHRVVEFAWSLPRHMKVRNMQTKWLLREVLYRHVPKELIERPKMGFGVPIGRWLRGPLREWAEDLLSERRLRVEGLLDPEPIRARWEQHLTGEIDWQYPLWGVLMFQAWHERWIKQPISKAA